MNDNMGYFRLFNWFQSLLQWFYHAEPINK